MITTARLLDAAEARACGFVTRTTEDVDATTSEVLDAILSHAPLTMAAGKEILRRLHAGAGTVDVDDVVGQVYGSEDFARGVAAFTDRGTPDWQGR